MNSPSKKLSIIIATYNAGSVLRDCFESIKMTGVSNFEIIISDGGSTDDTQTIVNEYSQLPISFKNESDTGIYNALNKGIARSNGEWLYFLGSDDRLLPGFSKIVDSLTNSDTIYYGISEEYYTGNKPDFVLLTGPFSNYKMAKYCLNHQSIIYPKSVFAKYRYEEKYKVFADYALNIKVWGDKDFNKSFVPVSIVNYHMSGFSSQHKDELFRNDKSALIKKHMGLIVYWRYLLKKYRKILGGEKNWY